MKTIELSIDLGSKYITIYQKSTHTILREPAIAIVSVNNNRAEISKAGYRALEALAGSLGGANVVAPIKEGIVVDEDMAAKLLKYFLSKLIPKGIFKPNVKAMVSICSASTGSERRAVEKCCLKAGISEVTVVEAPLSLLAYTGSIGGLFLDIGGGKTEIAAVTNHGIATGCSVNIAGDAFNKAIIDYLYLHYGVKLGDYTVETLKQSALSFYTDDNKNYAVSGSGRDGSPRSMYVSSEDMLNAVQPLVDDVLEVAISILDQAPPEISAEILRKGIFVTGGSMRIPGLVTYIEQALELPVILIEDMDNAVAIGGAKFFDDKDLLSDMLGVKIN